MIYHADCRSIPLPDGVVQCVITSPPYYGLRDYGTATWEGGDDECDHLQTNDPRDPKFCKQTSSAGTAKIGYRDLCGKCGAKRIDAQIGLEATPEAYLDTMVAVFRELKRVLREDGTVWLNIGDSYSGGGGYSPDAPSNQGGNRPNASRSKLFSSDARRAASGYKPKDLMGMPWRLAFALQADGWYLRSDIIWAKPNPMPESVLDRPTRSHEYIFLLTKRSSYYYDADAIREPYSDNTAWTYAQPDKAARAGVTTNGTGKTTLRVAGTMGRNRRDVWTIPSQATPEAHFATFPEKLVEPCVLAGTSAKGCCSECGAPYVRETEREKPPHVDGSTLDRYGDGTFGVHRKVGQKYQDWLNEHPPVTTGWRATCTHDAPIQPCLVFDPFLGSGTVGIVCERLGRRWAGTELSEAYIEIARKRTCQQGLFSHAIAD